MTSERLQSKVSKDFFQKISKKKSKKESKIWRQKRKWEEARSFMLDGHLQILCTTKVESPGSRRSPWMSSLMTVISSRIFRCDTFRTTSRNFPTTRWDARYVYRISVLFVHTHSLMYPMCMDVRWVSVTRSYSLTLSASRQSTSIVARSCRISLLRCSSLHVDSRMHIRNHALIHINQYTRTHITQ